MPVTWVFSFQQSIYSAISGLKSECIYICTYKCIYKCFVRSLICIQGQLSARFSQQNDSKVTLINAADRGFSALLK